MYKTAMSCAGCLAPKWDEEKKVLIFHEGNTFARGLTGTLVADFTPEFSTTIALKGVKTIKSKKHGRKQGNLADKDMSRWANDGVSLPAGKDPRFDRICQVIKDMRWIPIAAQFPVGCNDLRLATKIDLIVLDMHARIILIELKCGFDDYFDVHNQGNMKYPFEHVPASFRNKSYLQLMMTTYFFLHCKHRLSDYAFGGSYLLHVFETTEGELDHELSPLPHWTYCSPETIRQCVEVMRQSKKRNKKDCKRIAANGFKRARYKYDRQ